MIKILGTKRVLILLILLGINGALIAGMQAYLEPQKVEMERKLRSEKSKVNRLRSDIGAIQVEFEQLEQQQTFYEELKEKGFFSRQGRREAQILFEKIQRAAGISSANVKVGVGKVVDNTDAGKSDHKLLQSEISIEVKAIDDIDVIKYVRVLQEEMPGYINLNSLEIKRKAPVTGEVLQAIVGGVNPPLVTAQISALWTTMISEEDIIESQRRRQ